MPEQNTQCIPDDEIDLRELLATLLKRKKMIAAVTAAITILALIYALTATKWWKAEATVEIGKYILNGKTHYLENGSSVAQRLKIKYIDIYKNIKDRDSKIDRIESLKKNPQFITITSLAKSNKLALDEILKVINDLKDRHAKLIKEIKAKHKLSLNEIDRAIKKIYKYNIEKLQEQLRYKENTIIPAINDTISSISQDLNQSLAQKEKAVQNLAAIQKDPTLAALRLAEIQGLDYKISALQLKLINQKEKKGRLTTVDIPSLKKQIDKLKTVDLAKLKEKYNVVKLSLQDQNYKNTSVIGKIITSDHPAKPKKALIVIVAFITGLILSVFLAFFLEFLAGFKEENSTSSSH